MRAVIQRVKEASVSIEGKEVAAIHHGLLILLGIESDDEQEDVEWLATKIASLRIFSDADGKMNSDIQAVKGGVLVVSQFTLHAKTKKGNRPSFIRAAHPDKAIPLYEEFKSVMETKVPYLASGEFGADMQVALINDGPVTLIIDTKNKE